MIFLNLLDLFFLKLKLIKIIFLPLNTFFPEFHLNLLNILTHNLKQNANLLLSRYKLLRTLLNNLMYPIHNLSKHLLFQLILLFLRRIQITHYPSNYLLTLFFCKRCLLDFADVGEYVLDLFYTAAYHVEW